MGLESPISVLYNNEGYEIALSQSQIISNSFQPGIVIAGSGSDGRAYFMRVSNDGALFITGSIASSPAATQSVWVAGWQPGVTASTILNGWGTNVTGTVSLVPSASIIVGGWQTGVTASTFLNGWGTNVTGTVNIAPSASVVVGGWASAVTASMREIGAATTTVSSANASVTNFTFLSANPNRKSAVFFKEGSNTVFIKFGATASSTSYTVKLSNNGYYEVPENFTGRVDIVFSTAVVGNILYVTEITYP